MTAVTFVMVTPDGLALMELRKDGHWCYPGGKIEDGLHGAPADISIEAALIREMKEEVGCVPGSWEQLNLIAYGRTDQIGNEHYRMIPHIIWGWEGVVPLGDSLNLEGTPLKWVSLMEALGNGRGSCVSPIASVTLYRLKAYLRYRQEGRGAENYEPDYHDAGGVLRFGQGLFRPFEYEGDR